jgi:hypothetical protein
MANPTKYFVIDANGKKHTRNSRRIYTHAVLYRDSKEAALRLLDRKDNLLASNFWYHHAFVDGSSKWLEQKSWETEDRYKARAHEEIERSRKALRGCKSPEEWGMALRDEAIARINAHDYNQWHVEGWCGRHDLAVSLAHKTNGKERVAETIILPVEIHTF